MQLPFMVESERPFIVGEWRTVQEDHGVIIGLPSMEVVSKDSRVKGGECHMKNTL